MASSLEVPVGQDDESTSRNRIEANRRNAQRSTGPTSEEGKKTASSNALKHGLLAKDVVISASDFKEDQAEFDRLLEELRHSYQPTDIAEDLLVQELAVSYWRSARALRCERGDVSCTDTASIRLELDPIEITLKTFQPPAEAYRSLLATSAGIKFLLLKAEEKKLEVLRGCTTTVLDRWLNPEKNWGTYTTKELLLAELDREIEKLTPRAKEIEQAERARRDCSAIPSKPALDRIYRYETSNVRHRYRVEARLEQLQGRRRENSMNFEEEAVRSSDRHFCETKPTDPTEQ